MTRINCNDPDCDYQVDGVCLAEEIYLDCKCPVESDNVDVDTYYMCRTFTRGK